MGKEGGGGDWGGGRDDTKREGWGQEAWEHDAMLAVGGMGREELAVLMAKCRATAAKGHTTVMFTSGDAGWKELREGGAVTVFEVPLGAMPWGSSKGWLEDKKQEKGAGKRKSPLKMDAQ